MLPEIRSFGAHLRVSLFAVTFFSLAFHIAPYAASAEVKPGEIITKKNLEKVRGLVPEGVLWCV